MMTKKDFIDSMKDIPDDAIILGVQTKEGVSYGAYWGTDTNYEFVPDIMKGVKYVGMSSNFKLSDYK